jgi:hypothetical protein
MIALNQVRKKCSMKVLFIEMIKTRLKQVFIPHIDSTSFKNARYIKTIVELRALLPDYHAIIGKVSYAEGFY